MNDIQLNWWEYWIGHCWMTGWQSIRLGEDDTYPKEFLEYLRQLCHDIDTGKEKVYPLDEDFFDRIKELTDGVDVNLFDEEDDEE